jgi:hypothetical protein
LKTSKQLPGTALMTSLCQHGRSYPEEYGEKIKFMWRMECNIEIRY